MAKAQNSPRTELCTFDEFRVDSKYSKAKTNPEASKKKNGVYLKPVYTVHIVPNQTSQWYSVRLNTGVNTMFVASMPVPAQIYSSHVQNMTAYEIIISVDRHWSEDTFVPIIIFILFFDVYEFIAQKLMLKEFRWHRLDTHIMLVYITFIHSPFVVKKLLDVYSILAQTRADADILRKIVHILSVYSPFADIHSIHHSISGYNKIYVLGIWF